MFVFISGFCLVIKFVIVHVLLFYLAFKKHTHIDYLIDNFIIFGKDKFGWKTNINVKPAYNQKKTCFIYLK